MVMLDGIDGSPIYPVPMGMTLVALLRGINVGGRNRIPMADLKARFEDAGHQDVRTYIQSGNVVFRTEVTDREVLRGALERMLVEAFDYEAIVELRSRAELQAVVDAAPSAFGADRDTHLYDVLFLLPALQPDEVLEALTLRDGVDAAWMGPGVVYVSRLRALASRSGLSKIASHPFYRRMTIRNWNTTTRLLALMSG